MTVRDRPYAALIALSVLLFVAATLGSDVIARITIAGESLAKAISDHAYCAVVQPIGTGIS